jgi:hypothetical protein
MEAGAIKAVAQQLEAKGVDAGELHDLQEELDGLDSPPGYFALISANAIASAKRQWAHVLGELTESAEAMGIVRKAMTSKDDITAEEADMVRDQLWDMVRIVPASLIAVANAALPVPGTGLLTPWILHRLGVMPSRWREAHLLTQLHTEAGRLRDDGLEDEAQVLEQVHSEIEHEADLRDQVERDAALLTYWDANKNGVWDEEERIAYESATTEVTERYGDSATQKRWFLMREEAVIGPIRLSTYCADPQNLGPSMLVCWDGRSGWVSLDDVLERTG